MENALFNEECIFFLSSKGKSNLNSLYIFLYRI